MTTSTVTVRLFAGARAAAGGTRELGLAIRDGAVVRDVLDRVADRHPATTAVFPACSFLLDGVRAAMDSPVAGATTLDVLPPFSGG